MSETPDVVASRTPEMHEEFRRWVAAHPDLKIVTSKAAVPLDCPPGGDSLEWPIDSVITLDISRSRREELTTYVHKNRFPSSFPGKPIYDAGFGSGVTKEWLLANVDEYSRPTFDTVTCNGMGWYGGAGRLVELQGQPVPGTLIVERGVHRADLDGRVGLVIGSTEPGTGADLSVLWGPWRFKDAR